MRIVPSILLVCTLSVVSASGSPFRGELSLSSSANGTKQEDINLITRYLPAFEYQNSLSETWDYNLELRWQFQWGGQLDTLSGSGLLAEPYRVALNLQSNSSEYIIGLQKINFGSARILRPLMWFDSINPTDPLELTSGVTGVNVTVHHNIGWSSQAWVLLPGDPIGWEGFSDKPGTLEAGGRINIPNNLGQMGVSTHWRIADISALYPEDPDLYEGRIGLDGFWDVGIGLWFESVYKNQQLSDAPFLEQLQTTLGGDYTFWVGNGILLSAEHMMINTWNSPLVKDQNIHISTLMTSYSPTMFDQISLLLFMDWESETSMIYLSWGQTYDAFRFTLGGFYAGLDETNNNSAGLNSDFSGSGLQLTVIYNH